MKTNTKIWLILLVISTVVSLVLIKPISDGIAFSNTKIYLNFSTLGIIGLIFVALNILSFNVLFFKFLKSQPFNRLLFFATVPTTAMFLILSYYLLTLNEQTGQNFVFVRAVLNINKTNNNYFWWLGLLGILYMVFLFVTYSIACRPLRKVEKAIYRLGNGRVADNIEIGGCKQFKEIEHSLNKINDNFKEKENILEKTNIEYEKYIPKQFLKFLGKNSILELELGNQVQKEVTTMYVDIHSTASLGTNLSLEDNFNYINNYLNIVSPIIRKYGGFVDKYLGDGIIAVFIKPQNALECATAIVKSIENKNKNNSQTPNLNIGISINTGSVVFAVIGEEERKSPSIISESINLITKMGQFNKYFGSKITFSKSTLNSLKVNYPLTYRYVGSLTLEDKEYISLFESLEYYPKKKREKFEELKTPFEQAVRYFNLGKCHQAKELFQNILKSARDDKVAYMYFNKCEQTVCGDAPLRL